MFSNIQLSKENVIIIIDIVLKALCTLNRKNLMTLKAKCHAVGLDFIYQMTCSDRKKVK